jgi:hypothetical protein
MRGDGRQPVEDDRERVAVCEEACSSRVVHRQAGRRSLGVQRGTGDQDVQLLVLVGTLGLRTWEPLGQGVRMARRDPWCKQQQREETQAWAHG